MGTILENLQDITVDYMVPYPSFPRVGDSANQAQAEKQVMMIIVSNEILSL